MIKKIIPKEIQKLLMVGGTIFVLIFIWGGRFLYNKNNVRLQKIKIQRQRVKLENKVGINLNELTKIRKKMTVIQESSLFLAEVAKIAGQLNMKVKAITALPRETRNEFVRLAVSLEIDTSYHELGLFISKIEGSEVFMSIDKMELSSTVTAENAGSPQILAKLTVCTMSLTDTILEK
ncbi:MAG: type 4a pilus biogenesis protein PilO [Candidatus Omnitrophica bacterium]|nr:type 4a pilus biogenesis protein PilO [Candidatus Omnitrophota bacterium]